MILRLLALALGGLVPLKREPERSELKGFVAELYALERSPPVRAR